MLGLRFKPHNLIFALAASALAVAASSFAAEVDPFESPTPEPFATADWPLTIVVIMQTPGHYQIGARATTPDTLIGDLRTVRGDHPPKQVRLLLKSNEHISYEEFVRVLKAVQAEGYGGIALIK